MNAALKALSENEPKLVMFSTPLLPSLIAIKSLTCRHKTSDRAVKSLLEDREEPVRAEFVKTLTSNDVPAHRSSRAMRVYGHGLPEIGDAQSGPGATGYRVARNARSVARSTGSAASF